MDAQNERLGWLNKHAPQILASPNVSPQSRDQLVGKLRAINLSWSKVPADCPSSSPQDLLSLLLLSCLSSLLLPVILYSRFHVQVTNELLDKVGEVEANLQSHTQFQDRMNRLTEWLVITHQTIVTRGLSPGQAQVDLEIRGSLNSSHEPTDLTYLESHLVQTQKR